MSVVVVYNINVFVIEVSYISIADLLEELSSTEVTRSL